MTRIGFTGTRTGMSDVQREALRRLLLDMQLAEFHHGDCVGADAEAHAVALALGVPVVIHPPRGAVLRAFCSGSAQVLRPLSYAQRNQAIVDAVDVLVVAPRGNVEEIRSGTWATYRYARRQGVKCVVLPRNEARVPAIRDVAQ